MGHLTQKKFSKDEFREKVWRMCQQDKINQKIYNGFTFIEKYFFMKELWYLPKFSVNKYFDIIFNDFESLIAIYFLIKNPSSIQGYWEGEYTLRTNLLERLDGFWNLQFYRGDLIRNDEDPSVVDSILNSICDKIKTKIMSMSEAEMDKIAHKAALLIKENLDYFLKNLSELPSGFIESILSNKYIDLSVKRKLYDFILKTGKYMSFDYTRSIRYTPELLTFPKIFSFLSVASIQDVLFDLRNDYTFRMDFLGDPYEPLSKEIWLEITKNDRKYFFDLLRRILSQANKVERQKIIDKLLSSKSEKFAWLFEELKKEGIIQNEPLEKKEDIERKLGNHLVFNLFFNPTVTRELLIKYVEFLKNKYGLEFEIQIMSTNSGNNTLGYYNDSLKTLFINFNDVKWTKSGILELISTIHHEIIHALQFQREVYENEDYNTLIQIIDFCCTNINYKLNYAHISFENDANARAYVETQRFVTRNCRILSPLVKQNHSDDLNDIQTRVRLNFKGITHGDEYSSAIFAFLANDDLDEYILEKYPLLKKVFYYDEKAKTIMIYSESYFQECLQIAQSKNDADKIEFYTSILYDFQLQRFLEENPNLYINNPEFLRQFEESRGGRK